MLEVEPIEEYPGVALSSVVNSPCLGGVGHQAINMLKVAPAKEHRVAVSSFLQDDSRCLGGGWSQNHQHAEVAFHQGRGSRIDTLLL